MKELARYGLLVATAEQEIQKLQEYKVENEGLIRKYGALHGLYERLVTAERQRRKRLLDVRKNFGGLPPTREAETMMQIGSLIDDSEERLYNLIEECDKYTRYLFAVFDNKEYYEQALEKNSTESFYARCCQRMALEEQKARRKLARRMAEWWTEEIGWKIDMYKH